MHNFIAWSISTNEKHSLNFKFSGLKYPPVIVDTLTHVLPDFQHESYHSRGYGSCSRGPSETVCTSTMCAGISSSNTSTNSISTTIGVSDGQHGRTWLSIIWHLVHFINSTCVCKCVDVRQYVSMFVCVCVSVWM